MSENGMVIFETALRIREAALIGSGFRPNLYVLEVALREDMAGNGGHIPTAEECESLVGSESKRVPEDLAERFPRVNFYLNGLL